MEDGGKGRGGSLTVRKKIEELKIQFQIIHWPKSIHTVREENEKNQGPITSYKKERGKRRINDIGYEKWH